MKSMIVLFGLAASVLAAPAVAAEPAAAPAAPAANAPAAPQAEAEKKICRTDDTIGTRVKKKKICLTRAEWREVAAEANLTHEKRTATLARPGG